MSGGIVLLRNFPRNNNGNITYPFRLNGGYEFVQRAELIQSKKGAKHRLPYIRHKATGSYVPVHAVNTTGSPCGTLLMHVCRIGTPH